MGYFSFNGRKCTEFGMVASGPARFNGAGRDLEYLAVPGRNGSFVQDNGRYKNIPVSYPVGISRDFIRMASRARAWLGSAKGYCKLIDSYEPDQFWLAVFEGPLEFDPQLLCRMGEAEIHFTCRPERFLTAGQRTIQFAEAGSLHNPTAFSAQPVITVAGEGPGVLTVGGRDVVFHELGGGIVLDCESMDAFAHAEGGVVSRNSWIHAPEFPVLEPGKNQISFDGGITGVEIVPRWWTL